MPLCPVQPALAAEAGRARRWPGSVWRRRGGGGGRGARPLDGRTVPDELHPPNVLHSMLITQESLISQEHPGELRELVPDADAAGGGEGAPGAADAPQPEAGLWLADVEQLGQHLLGQVGGRHRRS